MPQKDDISKSVFSESHKIRWRETNKMRPTRGSHVDKITLSYVVQEDIGVGRVRASYLNRISPTIVSLQGLYHC